MTTPATETRRPAGAARSPLAWMLFLSILLLGIGLDLYSKAWAFRTVGPHPVVLDRAELLADTTSSPVPDEARQPALPYRLLDYRLVINRGAVFGIGANKRFFFIGFTILALSAGMFVFARYTNESHRLAHVALGCILAGGLGNLYDRVVFAVVRDFLHILPAGRLPFGWSWPGGSPELFPWVFNVADVLLLTGMGLLLIHINKVERRRDEAAAEAGDDDPAENTGENVPAA